MFRAIRRAFRSRTVCALLAVATVALADSGSVAADPRRCRLAIELCYQVRLKHGEPSITEAVPKTVVR